MKDSKVGFLCFLIGCFGFGCLKEWLLKTYVDGKPLETQLAHLQYVVEPYAWGLVILLVAFGIFHAFVGGVWNGKNVGKVAIVLVGAIVAIVLVTGAFGLYFTITEGKF